MGPHVCLCATSAATSPALPPPAPAHRDAGIVALSAGGGGADAVKESREPLVLSLNKAAPVEGAAEAAAAAAAAAVPVRVYDEDSRGAQRHFLFI